MKRLLNTRHLFLEKQYNPSPSSLKNKFSYDFAK